MVQEWTTHGLVFSVDGVVAERVRLLHLDRLPPPSASAQGPEGGIAFQTKQSDAPPVLVEVSGYDDGAIILWLRDHPRRSQAVALNQGIKSQDTMPAGIGT